MMSTWARLKKIYLLIAVIVMLLCAWRVSDFPVPEMPPRPPMPENLNQKPVSTSPYEENYYDVYINGELSEQSDLILKDKQGIIYVPVTALSSANIDIDKARIIIYLDQKFISLGDFPQITYEIDVENLALKLTVPLEYFRYHVVDMGASEVVHPPPPPWGAFLNYNFFATNTHTTNNVSAVFKLNIFSPYGVGNTTFAATTAPAQRPYVRLLTTWIIDDPDNMRTMSFGDNISPPTNWNGSVNFGGVQWGTNFKTQPTFITFPLPGFRGAAIVPTAMDLFINNVMVKSQKVAPGIYDITNIPMVDGYGNVKIITKDILGRDQIVNANYYISTTLLEKGLASYTYEFGLIRQDLGIYSNNYSQALAAATYGLGLTNSTTFQLHGELLSYEQAAGFTLTQLISTFGVFTGSLAFSKSYLLGKGGTLQLAFQRQTQGFSFGFSSQYNTAHFTQSGAQPGQLQPKLIAQIFASYPFGRSNLSANYTKQLNRTSPSISFIAATLSTSLFNQISLGFTMIDTLTGPGKKSYFLNLTYAMDDNTFLNGGYSNIEGTQNKTLQLIRQLPTGPGYGYSLAVQRGANNSDSGSLSLQNDIGTYIFRSTGGGGTTTNSLDVSGSLIYMARNLKMARTITTSFGYVHIPEFENIGIYYENQLISTTDKHGFAFVPNLLPFQKLKINIDPNTVPLNTQIDKYEDYVIPYRDAGALVEFKVKTIRSAVFTLKQENGSNVPEGADISIVDSTETFVSGGDGQVFVTNLPEQFTGHVIWGGGGCVFSINMPALQPDNPIPDIGIVTCKAETPVAPATQTAAATDVAASTPQPASDQPAVVTKTETTTTTTPKPATVIPAQSPTVKPVTPPPAVRQQAKQSAQLTIPSSMCLPSRSHRMISMLKVLTLPQYKMTKIRDKRHDYNDSQIV